MPASTVNQTLTNYARGIAQDRASALANFIAPIVITGVAQGQFKRFSDKNAFQAFETDRAIGGPARRVDFAADDPSFNCRPQALEIPIDDHERDQAGDSDPLSLEQAKIETLVSSATVSHEAKVLSLVRASVSATGGLGVWSSDTVDPVEELDSLIEAIANDIGQMPNRIAFGLGAWRVFRNHPKVLSRQPGAALIGVNNSQASQMLLNPGIEIRVGTLGRDTAKFGKAKSATNIIGADIFVFFGSDNPTTYDASFAKTFITRGGGVDAVRQYRDEKARSDIYAVDWSEDIQVVSPICGRRLTIS